MKRLVILGLVALLAGTAAVAMAAQPKPGVNLYGTTSWTKGDTRVSYVFIQVAPSGKKVASVNLPTACGIHPTPARSFRIARDGTFSGTRKVTSEAHGESIQFTLTIKGRFTAPTKARGTFSESFANNGGCHTGSQTWHANHVGVSGGG